jgi:VanZ family protein
MPAAESTLPRLLRPLAALTGAYTGLLVFATHYPKPEQLLGTNLPSDKTLHFLAYGALGLLAAALVAVSGRWSAQRVAALAAGLVAFAAIDEVTQPWFGRSAEPLDWVYDLIGLAAGIGVIVALNATIRSSRTRPGGPG